jgi:hypothetical protein
LNKPRQHVTAFSYGNLSNGVEFGYSFRLGSSSEKGLDRIRHNISTQSLDDDDTRQFKYVKMEIHTYKKEIEPFSHISILLDKYIFSFHYEFNFL